MAALVHSLQILAMPPSPGACHIERVVFPQITAKQNSTLGKPRHKSPSGRKSTYVHPNSVALRALGLCVYQTLCLFLTRVLCPSSSAAPLKHERVPGFDRVVGLQIVFAVLGGWAVGIFGASKIFGGKTPTAQADSQSEAPTAPGSQSKSPEAQLEAQFKEAEKKEAAKKH